VVGRRVHPRADIRRVRSGRGTPAALPRRSQYRISHRHLVDRHHDEFRNGVQGNIKEALDGARLWVPDTRPWTSTRGDGRRITFGMIDGRGVAPRLPDLLSTPVLDSPARPLGHRQGRGDSRTAPSTGYLAPAGRATAVLGGSRRHQRTGPIAVHRTPSALVRHPWHAPTLARRPGQATLDLPASTTKTTTHTALNSRTDPAHGPRESWVGIPAHHRRTRRHGPQGWRLHGLGNPQTVRDRSMSPTLGTDLGRIPAFPSTRDSGM